MVPEPVIHLIDDDEGVRRAIAFLLNTAGYAVRVYESGDAFLAVADTAQAGCVVTDIRMPGTDGLQLQRALRDRKFGFPVIVLTGHADVPLAVEAMKAGAVDFIEKPFDDEVLLAALRIAIDRHTQQSRQHEEIAVVEAKLAVLSAREREVLDGLVAGQANKTIGYHLGISVRTVEVHRANLMAKIGARSLSELVRMVFLVRSAGN